MKKIFLFCLLFLLFISTIKGEDLGLAKHSETAILMEASTKKILFEKESHKDAILEYPRVILIYISYIGNYIIYV